MTDKQRAVKLHFNRTFVEKDFKGEVGKIYDGKEDIEYEPICVFTEERSWNRLKFWKHKRNLIFFVEGCLKALRFVATTDELQTHWTKQEAKDFVYKMVMKALQEFKPIKFYQFVLLMIPQIISLIVLIRIATSMGAL